METSKQIVFVARGSRGDVEPVYRVACLVAESYAGAVVFITHAFWVEHLLSTVCGPTKKRPLNYALPSLPAGRWISPEQSDPHDDEHGNRDEEDVDVLSLHLKSDETALCVFNLFSWEAYLIAASRGIATCPMSPYRLPNPLSETEIDDRVERTLGCTWEELSILNRTDGLSPPAPSILYNWLYPLFDVRPCVPSCEFP